MAKQNKNKSCCSRSWKIVLIAIVVILALVAMYVGISKVTGKPLIMWDIDTSPVKCTDSDGGLSLYEKGTCKSDSSFDYKGTDSCKNSIVLYEYYCISSGCTYKEYNCNDACISGACMKPSKIVRKK